MGREINRKIYYQFQKEERRNSYFVFGLLMLNLFNFISNLQYEVGISSIIKYALIFCALSVFINKLLLSGFNSEYGILACFFLLIFVVRSFYLLLFSFELSGLFLQKLFVHQLYFLPYFIPVILLFTQFNIFFFKKLLHFTYIFSIVGLFINIILIVKGIRPTLYYEQMTIIGLPMIAVPILFMVSHMYGNDKIFNIMLLYIITVILIISLLGRRGGIAEFGYLLFFCMVIRIRSKLVSQSTKVIHLLFIIILASVIFISRHYLVNRIYAFQRGFTMEGWNESRGDIIKAFFTDFSSKADYLSGRGLNGTILRSAKLDLARSTYIENGFLTVLLKGGLLYMVPMVLIFIQSSYLGFFKTNNDLTKALASVILIHLLCMFSYGVPEITTQYVLIWICVSACYSHRLRSISNNAVIRIFNY